jgi:hypothetical protein
MTDNPPVPDPTILTTEQLERAIAGLRDLLETQIRSVDEACTLRFDTVKGQFILVELQRVEQKADTKAAVDAALTAQKEAVREQTAAGDLSIAKSEAAMTKQLDQLSVTFTTAIKAVSDTLVDVKSRLDRIESAKQGGQEFRIERRESLASFYALIATVVGVAGLIVTAIIATR